MHHRLSVGVLALLGICLLGLSGCAGSPPTRFYVLPSLTGAETAPPAAPRDLTIGVGPVTLSPYLDRLPIVTRASRVATGPRHPGPGGEPVTPGPDRARGAASLVTEGRAGLPGDGGRDAVLRG